MMERLEVKKMMDSYTNWLNEEITTANFGEYSEITLPYLDRSNDYLQIYVKLNPNGTIELTDDGVIIGNLIMSGITFRKNSIRLKALEQIAKNFNVVIDGEDIKATATATNFPQMKHMMVQAMLSIDDLFVMNPANVKNTFIEDIATYFDANEIFYSQNISIVGRTGTPYNYEFHIQRTKDQSERFCKGINNLTLDKRDATLQRWSDTQEKRGDKSKLIVIYNDEYNVKDSIIDGFSTYDIKTVPFSQRQEEQNLKLFS